MLYPQTNQEQVRPGQGNDVEVAEGVAAPLSTETSPLDVLIKLYEGAIDFLGQATKAADQGEVDRFKTMILRGRKIIEEFQKTLDFKRGGQITAQLNDLYAFMLSSLTQAELTHDVKFVDRVIEQLTTLLDGWKGARSQAVL